jgi:hypothetical protein
MVDHDAPLGEQFLDIALREAVAQIRAHRHCDHIGCETEPHERGSINGRAETADGHP